MALYLDVGPDDVLRVGEDLVITVERKSGSRARLRFSGPTRVELEKKGRLKPLDENEDERKS